MRVELKAQLCAADVPAWRGSTQLSSSLKVTTRTQAKLLTCLPERGALKRAVLGACRS